MEADAPSADAVDNLLAALASEDAAAAQLIRAYFSEAHFAAEQIVFEEHAAGDALYIVKAGRVQISRGLASGHRHVLMEMGPGDLFGEMALFDGKPRSAQVAALTDLHVYKMTDERLQALLERHPKVAINLLNVLSARLRAQNQAMDAMVATELQSAAEAVANHQKLQDAYRQIEDKHARLQAALKKAHIVRVVAALGLVGLIVGLGAQTWRTTLAPPSPASAASSHDAAAGRAVDVVAQRVTSTVSLTGYLAPARVAHVTSPISGKITARYFEYGQHVEKAQPLIAFDTAELQSKLRQATAAYIQAQQRFRQVDGWARGPEASGARRAVIQAKAALEEAQRQLEETSFLFARGVIPQLEYDGVVQQIRHREMAYAAAQEGLAAVLAKGDAEYQRIAKLELENARAEVEALERALQHAVVRAPIAGVVLMPDVAESSPEQQPAQQMRQGRAVAQGDLLVSLGDLDGVSVKGRIDEVDLPKLRRGQVVELSGDAFPDMVLAGQLDHISSQATVESREQSAPAFEITATVETLTEPQRQRLRLGMSANLKIVVYDNPEALVIPLQALQGRIGAAWVLVRPAGADRSQRRRVESGVTTLNMVEITRGLSAGEKVIVREM